MLGHDHIARNDEAVLPPHSLQSRFKEVPRIFVAKIGKPVITTESDEVELPGLLVTNQSTRHPEKNKPWIANVEVRAIPGLRSETWGTQL
jgi:hypothetical protein